MKRLGLVLLVLLLGPQRLSAEAVLTAAASQAQSLDQAGVGARDLALGSAAIALPDVSSALYWNPAGLAATTSPELALHHNSWLADAVQETATEALPLWNGGLGLSQQLINFGSFVSRDELGDPGVSFGAQRFSARAGWGGSLGHDLAVGAALQGSWQALAGDGALALSGDLGALLFLGDGLQFAATVNNVGASQARGKLPAASSVGLAWRSESKDGWHLALAAAASMEAQGVNRLQVGVESGRRGLASVRAGYNLGLQDQLLDGPQGFSLGAGAELGQLQVDYAYLPFGDLGLSQRFSLSWRLAGPSLKAEELPAPTAPVKAGLRFEVLSDSYAEGQALEAQGRPREALDAYRRSIGEDPRDVESWQAMGRLYEALGRADYAKLCQDRAAALQAPAPAH